MAVGDSLRSAVIGDELRENDEELLMALQRLSSIISMIVGASSVPIAEIHVSPLSLLQTRITDVKEISLYIALPQMATADVITDIREMSKVMLLGEFDNVNVNIEIIYRCGVNSVPTALMYSIFNGEQIENVITDEYFDTVFRIVFNLGYDISVPCNFGMQMTKTMLIHVKDSTEIVGLKRKLDSVGNGLTFIECLSKAKKSEITNNSICYIPMRSCRLADFNMPYLMISKSSFNQQIVEGRLNDIG